MIRGDRSSDGEIGLRNVCDLDMRSPDDLGLMTPDDLGLMTRDDLGLMTRDDLGLMTRDDLVLVTLTVDAYRVVLGTLTCGGHRGDSCDCHDPGISISSAVADLSLAPCSKIDNSI